MKLKVLYKILKHKKILEGFLLTKREKYLAENTIVVKNESDTFIYNLEKKIKI